MHTYSDQLIKTIIRDAGNDWDFELFCCRHYSMIEGFTYLPTSHNYDVGADGRKVKKRLNGESYIIASRQKNRLIQKVKDDVNKLKKGRPSTAKIRVCFAYAETEAEGNETGTQRLCLDPLKVRRMFGSAMVYW